MLARTGAEESVVLALLPPTRNERRVAFATIGMSVAVCLALAPFARLPLAHIPAFVPCYEAALVVCDLITAALLVGQFAIGGPSALLVLGNGYWFTALITIAHALSFPGAFTATGLLGAGVQSAAWLYMFWHAGFPLAVLFYAALNRTARLYQRRRPFAAVAGSSFGVAVLVLALTLLATRGEAWLPAIMQGNRYAPAMFGVSAGVWMLGLLALAGLILRRPLLVLDVWLIGVLCAWLCDMALSAVLNGGQYDLGFYAGRLYRLLAGGFLLMVLLVETIALYARLARSLQAERMERERRFAEMHAQLTHLARVNELGQMVSALAHEVNQPLTAIGNYLRAGQRLLASGHTETLPAALGKAVDEATRANAVIRRLRDYLKKNDSVRRVEELRPMLDETVSLALVGIRRTVPVALRVDGNGALALIDRIQIQQVLLNLIRNAVDATDEGAALSLVLATAPVEAGMIELSVADNGPGLPSAVRQRLFQPFVTTKRDGMGVGLSICQAIVEAHGGRIWAEDRPDGGTVFRFTVPCAPASG